MTLTPPDDADLANSDVLEIFMEFPIPLALLSPEGRLERTNSRFLERLGVDGLDATNLREMAHDPNGVWRPVVTKREGTEVRALPLRVSHRILLILDDSGGRDRLSELGALSTRIGVPDPVMQGASSEDALQNALRMHIGSLAQLAATDHLTGAWNRAHFDRVIESELARSLANRQPLSLIMFDIDHFKNINDTFGHAVGDMVLCELVALVRNHTRASDLLFRWRGEEFIVLLSSAGYRRAEIVAESLRQAVASHAFEDAGSVTVSLGVAEHDDDEDAATWFHRLDAALSESKRSGQNCLVVARHGNSDTWAAEGRSSALHLVWLEGYECGDPTIDAEHRELFLLANKLIDAMLPAQVKPVVVRAVLEEFLAHVQRHFADEEAILARLHYDSLDEHRRAHAGLIRRALAMLARLDAGELSLGAIVEFLAQDVVARHILHVDRAFFPLFHKTSTVPMTP